MRYRLTVHAEFDAPGIPGRKKECARTFKEEFESKAQESLDIIRSERQLSKFKNIWIEVSSRTNPHDANPRRNAIKSIWGSVAAFADSIGRTSRTVYRALNDPHKHPEVSKIIDELITQERKKNER